MNPTLPDEELAIRKQQKLQQAFDWARRDAPAVLFFDEIDALARPRDDAHEATHHTRQRALHAGADNYDPCL